MSSAASISAAKKRRANQVQPPTPQQQQQQQQQQQPQRPMTAPSLASLTPAQRQQFLMQQQQRMQQMQQQQQQQQLQPQTQQQKQQQQQQQQQKQQQPQQNPIQQKQAQGQGQPNKKPGLTWPAPPIYLMKQMDTMLFQQSQSIDDIKNRLNCIESGSLPSSDGLSLSLEQIKPELMGDEEFVSGIVDNIMTNSNLSDIIEQIDAVQIENRELRDLLYAQQKTINEMNIMLLKLFSQNISAPSSNASNASNATNSSAQAPAPDIDYQEIDNDQAQYQAQAPDQSQAPDQAQDQDQDQDQGDNIQLDVSNMQAVD